MQQGSQRAGISRTPQLLPTNPSFESQGLQHINLPDGRVLSFDPMNMDEQTRAFVEQHDRKQQIPTLPPARNGKVAAQRALGVAAQSAQPPIQHPPAQRMMVPNGQYCMDAQGRPVHVNAWQQLQQRSMPNGPYTSAQLQQLTPQQHQQMLQHQFAQQQYVQQQQLAQQRGSVPNSAPDSARPPPSQPGKSPSLLQVPPPPLQRAVSRTASRSASPIPPHLRPPSASISHPMQPTTSAMPISNSNPTLLPIRASTLPAASPANAMNLNLSANHFAARNSVAGPSQSAPATSTAQRAPDGGPRLDKPYRRDMKLSAVARARKREDMTSRLKRYIEQAQAQLEVVMREQEKAKVAAEKKDSVEEDGQENFNGLILDYLRRAGYSDAAACLQADMDRPARVPHAQGDTSLAKTSPESTLNEALQRSPRDKSSTGDATLIGTHSGDVSLEMKSPIKASPDKPLSPVRKVANGDSPSGKSPASSEKADESMDSEDSLFGQEGEAKETHDKEEEAVAHPGSTNGRTQVEDVESPIMVDEKPLPSEGKGRPHGFAPMPSDGARQGSAASQHRDLGYLYSWWTVFEDTQRLVEQKLLHPRRKTQRVPPMPSTAVQPTSAMATCIAVSAPAAAVRASSVDVSSQRTAGLAKLSSMAHAAQAPVNGSTHETGFEAPPTAVTAQLQAADAMRQSQQAHIDAQREEYKRSQVQAQNELMNQHGMMPAGPRQSMMLANGTQPHISQEDVQRHMMAQYAYQQQFIQSQNQQAQQIAQANGQTRADASNGGIRQFHPMAPQLAMQHRPDSSGSPSTDSGQPIKRQADQSPIEGPNKKPRLFGKRPTPEEHQRQALEMAARAAQQMPAPSGMSQMPGQMYLARAPSQVSIANQDEVASYLYNQGTPRPFLDAERQYTQSQVAYARQQVKKSPVNHVGISPAQGGEPSPLSITQSPSIYQSGFDFGINGTPTSARSKKSKQALSLVVDIDNVVDGPDVIPNSAAPTKRKQTKKVTPKGGAGLGKGKGGKGGKGRASICEAIGDTPPSATPAYNATASPIGQSNELFGGVSSAPQSGQSMTFQLPTTKLESRLPDRYDGEPQRAQQEQRDPMSYRSETAKHHDQQGSMQFQHHPNLHLQAQANGHPTQQSGMQQDPLSASQHDQAEADHDPQMTEDFLKALNEFGNESASGQHPPVSAFQGNFDEPAFDFDWATANFGGDENHDWAHLDPTAQEGSAE